MNRVHSPITQCVFDLFRHGKDYVLRIFTKPYHRLILRILGLQACFRQLADVGNENYSFVGNAKGYKAVKIFVLSYF